MKEPPLWNLKSFVVVVVDENKVIKVVCIFLSEQRLGGSFLFRKKWW
jgi:hypothetical protein